MNEEQRRQRARRREVFGVDQVEMAPGQVPTAEQLWGTAPLITHAAPLLTAAPLEHDPVCAADSARVEVVGYRDGRSVTRCLDCAASELVGGGG